MRDHEDGAGRSLPWWVDRREHVALRDLASLVATELLGFTVDHEVGSPAEVLDLAGRHGVVALLPDRSAWRRERQATRRTIAAAFVRQEHDLRLVTDAFAAEGVRWVALKGAALARTVYWRPDVRPFADADILVAPSQLPLALAALKAAGGQCQVLNWNLMDRLALAELPHRLPAGTQLDLHWSLVNRGDVRRRTRFVTDELLSGASSAADGLPMLNPVQQLVHVAWHCSYNGATRLLWLCDVELAAGAVLSQHRDVVAAAERARVSLAVVVALDRAGSAFPGGAAGRLGASFRQGSWRFASRWAGRYLQVRPSGRWSGKALARATVAPDVLSLRRLAGRSGPPRSVESLSDDSGGPARRASYLAHVETFGR